MGVSWDDIVVNDRVWSGLVLYGREMVGEGHVE